MTRKEKLSFAKSCEEGAIKAMKEVINTEKEVTDFMLAATQFATISHAFIFSTVTLGDD